MAELSLFLTFKEFNPFYYPLSQNQGRMRDMLNLRREKRIGSDRHAILSGRSQQRDNSRMIESWEFYHLDKPNDKDGLRTATRQELEDSLTKVIADRLLVSEKEKN